MTPIQILQTLKCLKNCQINKNILKETNIGKTITAVSLAFKDKEIISLCANIKKQWLA